MQDTCEDCGRKLDFYEATFLVTSCEACYNLRSDLADERQGRGRGRKEERLHDRPGRTDTGTSA